MTVEEFNSHDEYDKTVWNEWQDEAFKKREKEKDTLRLPYPASRTKKLKGYVEFVFDGETEYV